MKNGKMSTSGKVSVGLAALLCAVMAVFTGLFVFTMGPEYGIFGVDEVLFDVLSALGSGSSDYEKCVGMMRLAAFGAFLFVGVPCLVGVLRGKNSKKGAFGLMAASFFGAFGAVGNFLILLLYDFDGIVRGALLVMFFVLAVLFVVSQVYAAKNGGGVACFTVGLTAAMVVCMFVVPLFGWLFTLFGDIVWILLAGAMMGGPVARKYYVVVV